jgi:hypothetical protein
MTVETATYTGSLNSALPTGADAKAEGDDHIRLIKSTILATFPGMTGAMTATHTQLNKLVSTFSIVSAAANAVTIDASGNVGIGTAAPAAKLDVNGAGRFQSIVDIVGGAGAALFRLFNNTRNFSIRSESGGMIFKDESAASDRMLIDSSGNLVRSLTSAAPALSIGQMVVSLPSDTELRITVRGNDGATRVANIALA